MSDFIDPDSVLALADAKPLRVEVPEWKGHVFVRQVTAKEAASFDQNVAQDEASRIALIVARCVCRENGERVWKDSDVGKLNRMPVSGMMRIAQAVGSLNGLTEEAVAALGEASTVTPEGSLPSASPATSEG